MTIPCTVSTIRLDFKIDFKTRLIFKSFQPKVLI